MTDFVRATCAMTFNNANENPASLSLERGDLLPADHWAVRGVTNPAAFEDIRLSPEAEAAAKSLAEVRAEIQTLEARGDKLHHKDNARLDNLRGRRANLRSIVDDALARRDRLSDVVDAMRRGETPAGVEPGQSTTTNPKAPDMTHRTDSTPGSATRVLARKLVDQAHQAGDLPDHAAETVERMLTDGPLLEQNNTARWVNAAGDPAYRTAFAKIASDPDKGHMLWSAEEQRAYKAVEEARAMGIGTGGGGGYMVPMTLDPAIMLTNDGSINPLRQISRVVQTVTDSWKGITSAGVTSEWKAEHAEVGDHSPTLDDPEIPVHMGSSFVPYSFEVGMDAVNFLAELQKLLADSADQLMATAYTTGDGDGEPTGLLTALDAAAATVDVAPTAAEAFVADDVYRVIEALPPRFRARARWMAGLSVLNMIEMFETTNGSKMFPSIENDRLLRRPVHENSDMPDGWNTAVTADNRVLVAGDFQQFVIVDRIGTTLEFIPNLVGPNRRPTGQRGALMWFRTGSDAVIPGAFRALNIATTA
jgi:HK97 family phage major capsid protein